MNDQFHYACDGQSIGPVGFDELQGLVRSGQLKATDLVWQVGASDWQAASSVAGLIRTPLPPPLPALPPPLPSMSAAAPSRDLPASKTIRGIDCVRGPAINVQRSIEAWGNQEEVGTSHVLTLSIGHQAVQISMANLPQIENGDEVAVAGNLRQGTLHARAYKNWRNGTYDHWHAFPGYYFGLSLVASMFAFVFPPLFLITLPVLGICIYHWRSEASQNKRSLALVQQN